ncbi:MAG: ABC transporter substrate-binding protein [Candidatus Izemoplasma sp.]|nr:ABC transporter substrate-binding protein [Candidatus Izemoplasma sp.]
MKKLLLFLAAFSLTLGLAACGNGGDDTPPEEENKAPEITGVTDITITLGETFDALEGVSASDDEDGDLTSDIEVTGTVDANTNGTYTLTYTVTDSDGVVTTVTREVTVSDANITYELPEDGFYNFKFADTELRHDFMAAAEKYLMNNMYAGVPLFANGGFALYSSRMQLPVEEYVAVMGYGTSFATMSEDDSTVLMDDGEFGNAGEYTYRTWISTNPGTFNQWKYDTSTDSDLMGEYYDAPYVYVYNDDKTGYEVVPSMAAGLPVAGDDQEMTDTGKLVANTWSISIRDDLEWYMHPDVDTNAFEYDEVIDANDFVGTYKLALKENWFRAISGGGDFVTSSNAIVGAETYANEPTEDNWANVGITLVDDHTIKFEFVDQQSEWNVKYWLSSFVMTPINLELYEYLGQGLEEGETNPYGTSPQTIGMTGPYVLDYYEADKMIRFVKNDVFHTPELYFYTHKTYQRIDDSEIAFQEFEAGKLDAVSLPTEKYDQYKNHPGLKRIPGATTFRIMINGLGTQEAQDAKFPDGDWTPEPILANQDFKMAMFFAIDRQKLAEEVLKTSTTNMYLFSDAYLVDPELGIPYRSTEQGESVGEGLSPSTHGYNFDAAQALFKSAVEDLIADGDLTAGTADAYEVITIEFNYFADSNAQVLMFEYLKQAFESAFVDDENYVKVELEGYPKDFPGIYYDYMMIGQFDLSIGGISGSTLDAASFLDTYSSDNRSGFTLNWGIDTSVAEIEVAYEFDGEKRYEIWSFDAIHSVLNGEVYLVDGEEGDVPAATNVRKAPTSFTFDISQFDEVAKYTNITYTVQTYNILTGVYDDVAGLVDVTPTSGTDIEVTGLDPYFYGYDPDGNLVYQGDYQIVVEFEYVGQTLDDGTTPRTGSTTSPWFTTKTILDPEAQTEVVSPTDAQINVGVDADYTGTLDYAQLWSGDTLVADVQVTDLANDLELDGLVSGTDYSLLLSFADGNTEFYRFSTPAVGSVEIDPAFSDADMVIDLIDPIDTDFYVTPAITAATLHEYDANGDLVLTPIDTLGVTAVTPASGTDEDVTDFTLSTTIDLDSGTDYLVKVTYDDGNVEYFAFTTLTVLTGSEVEVAYDSANVAVELDSDYAGELTTATLYEADGTTVIETLSSSTSGVFASDLSNLTVGSLDSNTMYYVEYTFVDDGVTLVESVPFTTTPVLADTAVEATQTTAVVDFALDADFLAAGSVLDTVDLFAADTAGMPTGTSLGQLDVSGLAGSDFGPAELDQVELENLTAGTAYTLEFTFSDGNVEYVPFSTATVPTPDPVSALDATEVTETTADLSLTHVDTLAVASVTVNEVTYDALGNEIWTAVTPTVDFTADYKDADDAVIGTVVELSVLDSDTMYAVEVTFDDTAGSTDTYYVTTNAYLLSASVYVTETTADITLNLSGNATVTSLEVGANVVTATSGVYEETGLTGGTEYTVTVTFDDGNVETFTFTTAERTIVAN